MAHRRAAQRARVRAPVRGFTLVELLVALAVMAMMAVMGWSALDSMQHTNARTQAHSDAVLTLDAALTQWSADLDALAEHPTTRAIDWDGRALRITRRHSADPAEGVLVVAWTRAQRAGTDQWLRWQSAPVRSRQAWQAAWQAAADWAQSPSDAARRQEVVLAPLTQWQIYYFRGGAWSNPLSSSGSTAAAGSSAAQLAHIPDGVRLVLTLPSPHPLAGTLTRDWARTTAWSSTP